MHDGPSRRLECSIVHNQRPGQMEQVKAPGVAELHAFQSTTCSSHHRYTSVYIMLPWHALLVPLVVALQRLRCHTKAWLSLHLRGTSRTSIACFSIDTAAEAGMNPVDAGCAAPRIHHSILVCSGYSRPQTPIVRPSVTGPPQTVAPNRLRPSVRPSVMLERTNFKMLLLTRRRAPHLSNLIFYSFSDRPHEVRIK